MPTTFSEPDLEAMSTRELQQLYGQLFGAPTTTGNRGWIIRKILRHQQAVDECASTASDTIGADDGVGEPRDLGRDEPHRGPAAAEVRATADVETVALVPEEPLASPCRPVPAAENVDVAPPRRRWVGLSVAELQGLYLEIVGRPTSSCDPAYLRWKIREAERGHVRTGPRVPRGAPVRHVILPLRLRADAVAALDEVWPGRAVRSRTDFIRRAIADYLEKIGAADAAVGFRDV